MLMNNRLTWTPTKPFVLSQFVILLYLSRPLTLRTWFLQEDFYSPEESVIVLVGLVKSKNNL